MTTLYRNFCFTTNNYDKKPEVHALIDALPCKYMVYGKELGSTTGTPHLQGLVQFPHAISEKSCRKKIPESHVKPTRRLFEAIEYCKKDGDVTERGTPPANAQEKVKRSQAAARATRIACQLNDTANIPETFQLSQPRTVEYHRQKYLNSRSLPDTDQQHLWYYGEPGTGKSFTARTEHPGAYRKMCNKWWNGYDDEHTVIIEDFDKKHDVLCHHLKIWGDRYDFRCETKGSSAVIRPQLIIVTSNYHPEDIWDDPRDLGPILRRFKCKEFTDTCFNPSRNGPTTASRLPSSGISSPLKPVPLSEPIKLDPHPTVTCFNNPDIDN